MSVAKSPVFTGAVLDAANHIVAEYPRPRSAILPLCHLLQDTIGSVSRDGMREIAAIIGISPAEVLGTASFYTMFKLEPVGSHLVSACGGMSCMLLGGDKLYESMLEYYGVRNRDTTPDGEFTFEEVECLAACGGAPCLTVDYLFFENVDPESPVEITEAVRARGLDTVWTERGSTSAPLPPATDAEIAAGIGPHKAPQKGPEKGASS